MYDLERSCTWVQAPLVGRPCKACPVAELDQKRSSCLWQILRSSELSYDVALDSLVEPVPRRPSEA